MTKALYVYIYVLLYNMYIYVRINIYTCVHPKKICVDVPEISPHTLNLCHGSKNTIGESGESTTTYVDTSQPLDFQVKISKKRELVLRIPF